jgi:hypothetical protein
MKYFYKEGAVRWFRFTGDGDVRLHRPPRGWKAFADLVEYHPTTGKALPASQWWVRETYEGEPE